MKTCQPHGHNPPSRCPNCNIKKRQQRKRAAAKGWETRRKNHPQQTETFDNEISETFTANGWLS